MVHGGWPQITAKLTDFGLAKSFSQSRNERHDHGR